MLWLKSKNGFMPRLERDPVAQRVMEPVAQQAAAHAAGAFVEQREERGRGLAAQRLRDLEVAARGGVEAHVLAGALCAHRGDVRERLALGAPRVFQQRPARADREREVL